MNTTQTTETEKTLLSLCGVVLSTLSETNSGMPESTLYLALGMNLDLCNLTTKALKNAGLITVSNHYVTLTEKGKAIGEKLNNAMPKTREHISG